MRFIWVFVILLTSSLASFAQTVSYLPEESAPKLDVYGFPDDAVAPVMIYIHGGGWKAGSRRDVYDMPDYFNSQGFVFVSLDYTLLPNATVVQQLEEIDAALAWVSLNISDFGGDAARVYLMGHSAGAHLASMAVLRPLATVQDWLKRGTLKGVISNDVRAYDLIYLLDSGNLPSAYAEVFGDARGEIASLSPQLYLGGDALEGAVPPHINLPPFLVAYSGVGRAKMRDVLSLSFVSFLQEDGADVSVFFGEGYTHAEMNTLVGKDGPLTEAIQAFLANSP